MNHLDLDDFTLIILFQILLIIKLDLLILDDHDDDDFIYYLDYDVNHYDFKHQLIQFLEFLRE